MSQMDTGNQTPLSQAGEVTLVYRGNRKEFIENRGGFSPRTWKSCPSLLMPFCKQTNQSLTSAIGVMPLME